MRYLQATPTHGLEFTREGGSSIFGYTDADWAGDIESRRSTSGYVNSLQSEKRGEYKSDKLARYCAERGIQQKFTVPYTPQLNGVAERMNRTLVECARCMMEHAGLGKSYWGGTVMTAMFHRNRCRHAPSIYISSVDNEETDPGQHQSVWMPRVCSSASRKTLEVRLQVIALSFSGVS